MSIEDLEALVRANPKAKGYIVSRTLFDDLLGNNKLTVAVKRLPTQTSVFDGGQLDTLTDELETHPVLVSDPTVKVVSEELIAEERRPFLSETGKKSFKLLG